jgi:peptidoglycan L-alanyl-D-glutamate endopeptidase CwlK
VSLVAEQAEFLKDVAKLINKCFELGFVVTGGELFRTPEQQAIYTQKGLSKTSNSMHLKRCALDLNFFKDGKIIWDKPVLAPLGVYWESLYSKNRWGGNFSTLVDCPHFERNVG